MQHKKHLPAGILRIAVVSVVALGLGFTPLFAQSNTSTSSGSSAPSNSASSASSASSPAQTRKSEVAAAKSMVLKHWTAVANRNVQKLGNEYASDAVIAWVGGPLNGTYKGQKSIDNLWSKFANATSPMRFQVKQVSYDVSANRPAVNEDVVLSAGSKSIRVDSTLVYSNNKIVAEVWKVTRSDSGLS